MDELQLWSAALKGDDRAFSKIFDKHQVRVVRHAAHFFDERCDAEDVAAVAFLELWRLRRRVRIVNGSVLPWLLATTTNVARNTIRSFRRYNHLLHSLPRDSNAMTDPAEAIENQLSSQQARLLEHAMRSISRTDSTLLILTAIEGLSTADAARAIGIKPDTARVRLHRAKATARQILNIPEVTP
jgi:RNA polymerase sigma factor (sigma-70 family)